MQQLNWDDLRVFLIAAKQPSLAVAAEILDMNSTTISRRITALEKQLEGLLFDRSKRSWQLTTLGKLICQEANPILQQATRVERLAIVHTKSLQGRLRITAAEACFSSILLPLIHAFGKEHPQIQIELISTASVLDLAASEADVAFRVTENPPQDLVGYEVGRFGLAVYGCEANVKQLNEVKAERSDTSIACIDWLDKPPAQWIEQHVGDTARQVYCNSLSTMAEMTRAGHGLAQLYCVIGDSSPELQRLPGTYYLSNKRMWLLTHINVRSNERVKVFRDFAIAYLATQKNHIAGTCET